MTAGDSTPIYLIFGASGAIGSAVARRLSAQGAHLVLVGRSREPLVELADEVAGVPIEADARDFEQVAEAFSEAESLPGILRGTVCCVGSILLKPAHLTSEADFQDTIATNLTSAFATVRSGARALRKQGGSIVLVSSAAASIGLPNHEAIAAAKAGIEGLARSAAATYAGSGIRVNAVSPGLIDSPLSQRIVGNPKALEASLALHAVKRAGRPDEVASIIEWLMGAESEWVTGQVWGVDGGLGTLKAR